MENLLLPKGRLSWSQYIMWKKSPDRYVREYFEGADKLNTKYLHFGKVIHEMIENDTHQELLPGLEVYEIHEHEINTEVCGVPIISFLDSYSPSKGHLFRDTKTGKTPWTLAKVYKHEQLVFYAMALKWSVGVVPEKCYLDWVETEDEPKYDGEGLHNQREVKLTGKLVIFERLIDEREVERLEKDLVKVALEISNCYRNWIAEI